MKKLKDLIPKEKYEDIIIFTTTGLCSPRYLEEVGFTEEEVDEILQKLWTKSRKKPVIDIENRTFALMTFRQCMKLHLSKDVKK